MAEAAIRAAVPLPPGYDDGFNIARWLRAWDGKVDEVIPRLRRTLEFRAAMGLDEVPRSARDDYLEWAKDRFHPVALQYYPGGFSGYDRDGNVILIEPMGRCDPKGLMPVGRCSEFFRSRLAETEWIWRLVIEQEKRTGKRQGLTYIMDLEGLTMDKIALPIMHIYMDLIKMLQDHYPDLLHRLLIIKAPTIVHIAYNMISPILAKQTREKLEIVGGDWGGAVSAAVADDQLPPLWGGTNDAARIRMGGDVPTELHYKAETNPMEPSNCGEPLTRLSIPRGSSKEVDIVVPTPSRVDWYFRVPHGDVFFSVAEKRSGRTRFPRMRLNTERVPEWGSLDTGPTTLVFLFDNHHSYLKAKALHYYVRVRPLEELEEPS